MAKFRQALDLQPAHADALLGLGIACEAVGDYEGAVVALRAATKAAPRNAAAHHNLGVVLEQLAQTANHAESSPADILFDAEVALHAACSLDPTNAESLCQLGVVLLREGKVLQARSAFDDALKVDPLHYSASANLSQVRKLCDQMCETALANEPQQDGPSRNVGDSTIDAGEMERMLHGLPEFDDIDL